MFPSARDLPDPGIEPAPPALLEDYLITELSGKPAASVSALDFWNESCSHNVACL